MVFFFTRYIEGEDSGFIYFDRPGYLGRRQYQQVTMDRTTFLSHEGSWFGAFYFQTDGGGMRHLRQTFLFFGTGAEVWARMRRRFQGFAQNYHVKPLKVIEDKDVIRLVNCKYCRGKGKIEIPALLEYLEPTTDDCDACAGTGVEEETPDVVVEKTDAQVKRENRIIAEYEEILCV